MDQMFDDDVDYNQKYLHGDIESLDTIDNHMPPIDFDFNPPEKFRAKLYNLDAEGRWHDLGTGYFSIVHTPDGLYKMKLIQE